MNYQLKAQSTVRESLKVFATVSIILLIITIININAQIDATFGTNGVMITDGSGEDRPLAAFILPDEKILVVNEGNNAPTSSTTIYYLLRYNSDGSPDATYGTNGKIQLPISFLSSSHYINKAVRQPDGKIVLFGSETVNALTDGIVVRVNENGTLDTSFGGTGIQRPNINQNGTDFATSAVIQPDGKILVAGYITNGSGSTQTYLLRYLSNGSLDTSFGNGGYIAHSTVPYEVAYSLHLQSNGKILTSPASGIFGNGNGATGSHIRRYNADGSVDNSFTPISRYFFNLRASVVQSDDKILTAESFEKEESLGQIHTNTLLTRYNSDGTIDTSFGVNNNGQALFDVTNYFYDTPYDLKVLADGQILVSVITSIPANRSKTRGLMLSLARLSPNGVINGRFLVTQSLWGEMFLLTTASGKVITVARIQNTNQRADVLLTRVIDVPSPTYRFQAVPFDFLQANGVADVAIYRPSERRWFINEDGGRSYVFGIPGDVPVPSDYTDNFGTEIAVFRPSTGQWFISRNFSPTSFTSIQWGEPGDVPAPADYDGDGKSDIAVFRPSTGNWHIRNSANNSTRIVHWGLNGDKPAPGDYDGDGLYDIAVFRPSDGNWYILRSSDGGYTITRFGLNGDIPVQEDYDGDGKFDIAVWRPSDRVWYRLNSSDGSFYAFQWGISSDTAAPADYDGDGKTDIAVWRAAEGRWYVLQSATNSMIVYNWGINSDIPLPGKF